MSANNTLDWSSQLSSVVTGINNSPRSILYGFSSVQAQRPKNSAILKKKFALKRYLYQGKYQNRKFDLKVGDRVKILKKKSKFDRGYTVKTYSRPDFVKKILETTPKTILLENHRKKPFYLQEVIRYPISTEDGQNKFDYFITEQKNDPEQSLRSGVSLKSEKKYKIQSHHSSDFSKWINDTERLKLVENGKLPPFD